MTVEIIKKRFNEYINSQDSFSDYIDDNDVATLLSHIETLEGKLKIVKNIHEQFKHLDILISDKNWIDDKSPLQHMLYDCWSAIKKMCE